MVGGGILVHGIGALHHAVVEWAHLAESIPGAGAVLGALTEMLFNLVAGVLAGAAILGAVTLGKKAWPRRGAAAAEH